MDNSDLSLLHYLKIPLNAREPATWNNLGVAFDRSRLNSKSVEAYKKAGTGGETLAKGNLAFKFITGGFLEEARSIIDEALRDQNCNNAVHRAVTKIAEETEREEKELEIILERARSLDEFYSALGKSMALVQVNDIAKHWEGVDCFLEVTLERDVFVAKGQYERSSNALMGLGGLFGSGVVTEAERWTIEYTGRLHGRAVTAQVQRQRVGDSPPSFLGSIGKETTVLMILSGDGAEFDVMEKSKDQSPKMYKLTRAVKTP